MNIAFVGGGNMATALIGGLLERGCERSAISVAEIDAATRERLSARFGVHAGAAPGPEFAGSDVIVLAVKPQHLRTATAGLDAHLGSQLVLSIAAGIRTADLSRWLGGFARIVRAMPNTPALVLAGVSALYAMPAVTQRERQVAESILGAVGSTLWVESEESLDAVTAVSGSGPAYVFYFIEALEEAALDLGLSPSVARQLSLETFLGAARLASDSAEEPAVLRARVTSKGGTTERALRSMEDARVRQLIVDAVRRAAERSHELGDELGRD
jgi:pyrroline-5-carboxylate reductase